VLGFGGIDGLVVSIIGFCSSLVSQYMADAATPKAAITATTIKTHRRRSPGSMLGSSRIETGGRGSRFDGGVGSRGGRSAMAETLTW
jgi:hypothetical protein